MTRLSALGSPQHARMARRWDRGVIGGGSYQSASDVGIHIGLGERRDVPLLRILWPSGEIDEWRNVAAGSYLLIEQGNLLPLANSQIAKLAAEVYLRSD